MSVNYMFTIGELDLIREVRSRFTNARFSEDEALYAIAGILKISHVVDNREVLSNILYGE